MNLDEKEFKSVTDTIISEIEGMSRKLDNVNNCLLGNAYTDNKGLVHKVNEHENRLSTLETRFNRVFWTVTGIITAYEAAKYFNIF